MARILAIDYGAKRCGLAATDNDQIIASAIGFEPEEKLFSFLETYLRTENVEEVVVGFPTRLDGSDTHATDLVKAFVKKFEKTFPDKKIVLHDETYTSKMAMESMVSGGMKKKKRREKGNLDAVAATLILQSYMVSR